MKDNCKGSKSGSKSRKANYNRNRSKSSPRSKDRAIRDGVTSDVRDRGDINDASYYFPNDVVMDQISRFSFNQFMGFPFNIDLGGTNGSDPETLLPTIMMVSLNPSAGAYNTGDRVGINNGINAASKQLFLKLSAGNMKSTEYGPEDVGLAMLAIGNVLESISYIKRFFGILGMVNPRNRAVPDKLINAFGIDVDDFRAHFADYKARFNYVVSLANQIPFPANVPYFYKCATLYDNVYLDATDSSMAQLYVLRPWSGWKFNDVYSESGSGLSTFSWVDVTDMGEALDILEDQILALTQSTALLRVYSDILRLIDKENMTRLIFGTMPDDYGIIPIYNAEFMSMLQNAVTISSPRPLDDIPDSIVSEYGVTNSNDVVGDADTSSIRYAPCFRNLSASQVPGFPKETVINFSHDTVSSPEIVEATRFVSLAKSWITIEGDRFVYAPQVALPDHYVVIFSIDVDDTAATLSTGIPCVVSSNDSTRMSLLTKMTKFSVIPRVYVLNSEDVTQCDIFGDLSWFTTIDYEYVQRVSDFAMLGLLSLR